VNGFNHLTGLRRWAGVPGLLDPNSAAKLFDELFDERTRRVCGVSGIWTGRRSDPLGNLQERTTWKYLHWHPMKT
jgi:hypothetical protein